MEKIQEYAIIGNGRSAALISKKGSIDWLCWPQFDSPSFFAKILDEHKGGFWEIRCKESTVKREYIENTNVLQTHMQTVSGSITITDFMTAFTEEEKNQSLQPEHELIRLVTGIAGEVEVEIIFCPKPNFALSNFKLRELGKLGLRLELGQHLFNLRSDATLVSDGQIATSTVKIKAGEKVAFSLDYTDEGPAVISDLSLVQSKLDKTVDWWKKWSQKCTYQGPFRKEVIRSALALKLLGFAPSGAFVAAPTTSLPERLGGDLNWDYRFCWLRDAAFTVHALFDIGYKEEADAFVSWLLHSTRVILPQLKVLYNVYGKSTQKETLLTHFSGYKNSLPVRIGNEASIQKQLDVYGEIVDAVHSFFIEHGNLDSETKRLLSHIGKFICKHWSEPDNGIWEVRKELKHYTHSRLMCWVALDRLIDLDKKNGWLGKSLLKKIKAECSLIKSDIKTKAWNPNLNSYTTILNGNMVDASLMLFSFYNFESSRSDRMEGTYQKIQERLYKAHGLIYRWEPSIQNDEGAFTMCSFWNVEFLANQGKKDKALELFQKLIELSNDVGLYSEEIDMKTKDFLGNFPQAFTHIGLINAALAISKRNDDQLE